MSGKKKKEKSRSGRRIVTQAVMRQQGKKHRRARGTGGQEWDTVGEVVQGSDKR